MNNIEMLMNIKQKAKGDFSERIASELVYAYKTSVANEGIYDIIVNGAIEYLHEFLVKNGTITYDSAMICEHMLMPISPAAKKIHLLCVSHAHIDMNWQWSFNETVAITLDTFRTVLKIMEEYPDFTFSQSQASTYRIVEEFEPEMFERIKHFVKSGRWEVTASTWVESDKNMPSGESLARHLLYTKNYFLEKFGLKSEDLSIDFEPDTFGHSAMIPEILSQGKVKFYYHCRGFEDHNIYNWRAPSGHEVLVYREPTWYNSAFLPDSIEHLPEFCKDNGIEVALKVYGVGDHGGGPTRRDVERIIDMSTWPIAPTIEFGRYDTFFRELEKSRNNYPTISGELNFVFTGCYSSQSRIKRANKFSETNLFISEATKAFSVNFADGVDYSHNYNKAWEKTLFNQFHDILPGSCVRDTREYALGYFQDILGYTYAGKVKALTEIADKIDTSSIITVQNGNSTSVGSGVGFSGIADANSSHYGNADMLFPERGSGKTRIIHVFNPTQYERKETIEITVWDYSGRIEQLAINDINGNSLKHALIGDGKYWSHKFNKILVLVSLPSFGYTTIILNEKEITEYNIDRPLIEPRVEVYPENILENEYIKTEFDSNMVLIKLTNKKTDKILLCGKSAFFSLEEKSNKVCTVMKGNAWVEGFTTRVVNLNETWPVFIENRSTTSLQQSIKYSIPFKNSKLSVTVSLSSGTEFLNFSVQCDWHEIFSKSCGIPALKFCVPINHEVKDYLYQIPFGSIVREPKNHDVPSIGFSYAKISEKDGVALISDSTYAYHGGDNFLSATILRATQEPDEYPEYGLHNLNLAIFPCNNDLIELYRISSSFLYPITYFSNSSHKGNLPLENSFLKPFGTIAVSAIKTPEDKTSGIIIRVYDLSQQGASAGIIFFKQVVSVIAVDILENAVKKDITLIGSKVMFNLIPGEIITLKVEFA